MKGDMKESSRTIRNMATVMKYFHRELITKENTRTVKPMAKGASVGVMERLMMESGCRE